MSHSSQAIAPTVPLVVQVGFAGSRMLFDRSKHADLDPGDIEAHVFDALVAYMRQLPDVLGLSPHHFLCGASQIAVGADTLFTRACQTLGIPQRILLPEHRDAYLAATGSDGTPDFTPEQQMAARDLLSSPHIIEERVVSHSRNRSARFEETNSEILGLSDVIICLVREAADGKRGGTEDLINRAEARGTPVAEIAVAIENGKSRVSPLKPLKEWRNGRGYTLPLIPDELTGVVIPAPRHLNELPKAAFFIKQIKEFASAQSSKHSGWFKRAAIVIIGFHLVATVLASFAFKFHEGAAPQVLFLLLGSEVLLLLVGLGAHVLLHHSANVRIWAVNRLVAETMRSLAQVEKLCGDLEYPMALPVPERLLPLLRTCAVLHLCRDRSKEAETWQERRDAYVNSRLKNFERPDDLGPQLPYYEHETCKAKRRLWLSTRLFYVCSFAAIIATLAELLLYAERLPAGMAPVVENWGSFLTVVLPVAAVGLLSWAAASDLEARVQTFTEMQAFLQRQIKRLKASASESEFGWLVRETESRLLGENLNWFSRRFFISVA